jgi:hypothetical protein
MYIDDGNFRSRLRTSSLLIGPFKIRASAHMATETLLQVSLADLIDTRAAERTFQSLLSVVHDQSKEIFDLKSRLDRMESHMRLQGASILETQQVSHEIDKRLTCVEGNICLPRVAKEEEEEEISHCSIGAIVSANVEELQRLRDTLATKVDVRTLHGACDRVETTLQDAIKAVRSDSVAFEVLSSLQVDQDHLYDYVTAMDQRLACKMDKVALA